MNTTHLLKYPNHYGVALLIVYVFINNSINATSDIMEAQRAESMSFALWEPFVWEYSSAISTLMLVPAIVYLLFRWPFSLQSFWRSLAIYGAASLLFSALHVGVMVALRN